LNCGVNVEKEGGNAEKEFTSQFKEDYAVQRFGACGV
jgi:hypothetical protein